MDQRNMRAGERRKVARYAEEFGRTMGIGITGFSFARAILPVLLLFGIVAFAGAESHGHHSNHAMLGLAGLGLGTAVVDGSALSVKALKQKIVTLKTEADGIITAAADKGFTDDGRTRLDAIHAEILSAKGDVERIEAFRATERAVPNYGDAARADISEQAKKPYASIGEQLIDVVKAAREHRPSEKLLALNAAASGHSEGVPADGGFLVQQDFSTILLEKAYSTGILAGKVTRIPLSANSNGIKLPAVDETSRVTGSRWGGIQVFWAAEADTVTAKKVKLRRIELELKKLMGLAYVTNEELEDASALTAVINKAFPEEFGFILDDAILRGTGAGQPQGFLNALCTVSQAAEGGQTATTVNEKNVVKMYSRMPARLLGGAEWFINQNVFPQLPLMVIGQQPVFQPPNGLAGAPNGTLLGKPINIIEQCESLGTVGDIIFANLGEYVMIDKGGLKSDISMHVRFLNDEQVFRWTYRCDGQPAWNDKLTPYKGAATLSPFVTLAAR
jgi:HK97 family phage major capsid protein